MNFKSLVAQLYIPMSRTHLSTIFVVLVLSVLMSGQSFAQIALDISGGEVRGIPTAIVPFKYIDGEPLQTDMASIVSKDLAATGKFDPINADRFLTQPSRSDEVRYKDWRFLGAEVLVIGEIWKVADDNFELKFRMFDVAREKEIGTGKIIPNLRGTDLRAAAHLVSDEVYQSFTGRPGAFNSRIAYIKRDEIEFRKYQYKLVVADWDGFNAADVYTSSEPLLSPSWSPDAKKLAFVAFSETGSVVQSVELVTGQTETIAAFNGINSAPSWSPDGTKLAYSSSTNGSPDVYIYSLNTKQHTRITKHYAIDTEPSWTPSGDGLLFTSNRSGKPQIYAYRFSDERLERITFEGEDNANATYDFDGKRIVLVHEGGKIAVFKSSSGGVSLLTNAKFDESPSFSHNGDMVLYTAENDYGPALVVASTDGRVKTRLEYVSGDVREPAWSPLK